MDTQIASSLIALLGTLAGAYLGIWSQRETKRIKSMERRIDRYKQEIRARQAEEDIACEWLVETGLATSIRAAQLALRERTESQRGLRPTVPPSEVVD